MAVTIKDVSARCGLSVSTVSKAFNNYADISSETRELVRRTAREIGYYPNAIARTLKTNRSYNLGVLYDDESHSGLTHAFFAAILESFKTESERRGYDLTFINHHMSQVGMTYLEHCRYRNVDGVFIACTDFSQPEVAALGESDIPCVAVDYEFPTKNAVMSENVHGMQLLTQYIISKGYRRIAFVHGQKSPVTDCRIKGFLQALRMAGLEAQPEYMLESVYDVPVSSRGLVLSLLQREDRPTCICLPDDHCCIGALQAVQEMGYRVPQDVSLAGFDGIQLGQVMRPRLTTIAQDTVMLGAQAARMLISSIETPSHPPEHVEIPVRLVEGDTVGAPPRG